VAQQVREATPFGEDPRFLICDNDGKYGPLFDHAVEGAGITLIHTPPYAPQANAICERFMGSVRREFLDHILILSEGHARRLAKEYVLYFNYARPHQGLEGQIPIPPSSAFLMPLEAALYVGFPF
jgi:putative transposase